MTMIDLLLHGAAQDVQLRGDIMMFIGGPLHGQRHSVPRDEPPDVLCVTLLIEPGVTTFCRYLLSQWFVAAGKPTIPYYALEGPRIDDLIEMGRHYMNEPVC